MDLILQENRFVAQVAGDYDTGIDLSKKGEEPIKIKSEVKWR